MNHPGRRFARALSPARGGRARTRNSPCGLFLASEGQPACLPAGSACGPAKPDPRLPLAGAQPRGFTLIEVLVTIVILAVIAAMAWRGVDAIVRSKDGAEQRLDAVLRLGTVVNQWERDLASLHDAQVVPPIQFDGISLRLTRRTELGVQIVVWSLRSGVWLRWAAPPVTHTSELQDMWMRSQQLLGSEPGTVAALPGISQWQLFFWRNNAWSNPQSSGDIETSPSTGAPPGTGGTPPIGATPPGGRQALPQGVRLILIAAPGSGLAGSLTRDIVLRSHSD